MTVVELRERVRIGARGRVSPLGSTAWLLLVPVGFLLAGGLMMILSASSVSALQEHGTSFLYFTRQLTWAVLGIAAMLVCSLVDYRRWRHVGYALLALSVFGLVAVLVPGVGVRAGGSSRWLQAGPLRVQPSEVAKLALILVAADLCVRKAGRMTTMREVMLPLGCITAFAGGLVMLQPDLGTTMVLGMLVFVILFVGGTALPALGGIAVCGGFAASLLALGEGYRRARLFSFLDPFGDPLNSGYQAVQSMIALGSGGVLGVGLGASRQKWLYVPNAHTDFIFSIIGEETGLIGTIVIVALFALLAYAGVRIARRAPDPFGRLVATGITAWVVGQAVINMGAVTGLLPITGVPLPLVSFGGSALVFTLAALGIMINIARQEVWPPPREEGAEPGRRLGSRRALARRGPARPGAGRRAGAARG